MPSCPIHLPGLSDAKADRMKKNIKCTVHIGDCSQGKEARRAYAMKDKGRDNGEVHRGKMPDGRSPSSEEYGKYERVNESDSMALRLLGSSVPGGGLSGLL